MAAKKGLAFVPLGHELIAEMKLTAIESNIKEIISEIERKTRKPDKQFTIKLSSHSNKNRPNSRVLQSLLEGDTNESIKLIYSDKEIDNNSISLYFSNNTLITIIQEVDTYTTITPVENATGCKIFVQKEDSKRIIEDIFIDIYLLYLSIQNSDAISALMTERQGLANLFGEEKGFFLKNANRSYISNVAKDAGYAPISALNKYPHEDKEGRADSAIKIWSEFQESLTYSDILRYENGQTYLSNIEMLKSIPGIGGQLSINKIKNATKGLPEGKYVFLLLVRAGAIRTNPKIRNKIEFIFGKNAKRNKFIIRPIDAYSAERHVIRDLISSGHIFAQEIQITS
ncbi:hypothetical protein [Rhizobium halophytocola]|uniref:Uncharacterized protein n=1 Tax=Rhizobium halophytocola TaxID=735519 RepID=A0ABS4E3B2_9HYPH|nr:hypothetical protein [Rhizobium halophytocola]MBP1852423.1 hypothetical protein [Rhizobium halophytocola]